MKHGLILLGILALTACSDSNDTDTTGNSSPILLDSSSQNGSSDLSPIVEEALLNAARPEKVHIIFNHIEEITSWLTISHGSPSQVGQSGSGLTQLTDIVDCDGVGSVARTEEIIDENLGYSTKIHDFRNCLINGVILNGVASHLLIEPPGEAFSRGLQITGDYKSLSVQWTDGSSDILTGEFTSSTNQRVDSSRGSAGNDFTETYEILELGSSDLDGTTFLRNLEVRNSYRSYGSLSDKLRTLQMIGSWSSTPTFGDALEIAFDLDPSLSSDESAGTTGKLVVSLPNNKSLSVEAQGEYEQEVVVTQSDTVGATTSDIVIWTDNRNLLDKFPRADCHMRFLAPICAVNTL